MAEICVSPVERLHMFLVRSQQRLPRRGWYYRLPRRWYATCEGVAALIVWLACSLIGREFMGPALASLSDTWIYGIGFAVMVVVGLLAYFAALTVGVPTRQSGHLAVYVTIVIGGAAAYLFTDGWGAFLIAVTLICMCVPPLLSWLFEAGRQRRARQTTT
jgi:hypothetical protein